MPAATFEEAVKAGGMELKQYKAGDHRAKANIKLSLDIGPCIIKHLKNIMFFLKPRKF